MISIQCAARLIKTKHTDVRACILVGNVPSKAIGVDLPQIILSQDYRCQTTPKQLKSRTFSTRRLQINTYEV